MTVPVIHDLGYRHYEGNRVGARAAWWALFWQGFRAMFGMGRPLRAKAIPSFVIGMTLLPCLGTVVASATSGGQAPIRYGMLIGSQLLLFVLFLAAQVPEVMCRDRQLCVLPLLLTRALSRWQYASARLAAIWAAMWVVAMAPLVLLWTGEVSIAADPATQLIRASERVLPVLLHGTLTAWVLGSLSALMASLSTRRGTGSALVAGLFLVAAAVTIGVEDLTVMPAAVREFLDPLRALRTMAMLLFQETTRAMELTPPPPVIFFVVVFLVLGGVASALTIHRLAHYDA